MIYKLPIYHGGDPNNGYLDMILWAREHFGGDFVDQWELRGDNHYWKVCNFRNEEDAAFFKLKFGL